MNDVVQLGDYVERQHGEMDPLISSGGRLQGQSSRWKAPREMENTPRRRDALFMRPAGDESAVAAEPLPTSGRVRRESPAGVRRADPSARCSRWRCSSGCCCNARHSPARGAVHPAKAVFQVGCSRSLATCASARFSRSIGDSRVTFAQASCRRFE